MTTDAPPPPPAPPTMPGPNEAAPGSKDREHLRILSIFYYVFGGLLFVPLTRDYLKTWGDQWIQHAPRDLVALYEKGLPTLERGEPVVLQKVLADRVNRGYHDLESVLVREVQGVRVRNLRHVVELIEGDQVIIDEGEHGERLG